uniref:Axin-2 n=1 Tax=Hofstenia miamia TaxID=442651 RepID=A0A068CRP7_HOFMI|nr:axin-2 [Hofstenia miamia]
MSITDSSVDYSQPTNKRFQHMARRERRNMKSTAAKNGPQVLPYIHLPPRTQSEMNNDPNIFAEILITRLEKLKKEQDREESAEKKLSEKLRKCEVDAGLEPSSQARLRSMIVATQDPVLDDTEDMLEAHCSRVFHDGCYSPGRCHSCGAANTLPAGGFSSQKKPRRVRTTNTGGRKCETSSSGKSTSSGVDSGVYDGTSHHSSESRSSDKQQMVRDWVRQSSFEPGRHKPKHNSNRFASLSPGPIPRITSFNRKSPGVQNSRSGSLERQAYIVGGNLSVYAPNIRPTDDAFSGSLRGQILPSGTLANSAPETECLLDPTKQRSEERKKSQKKDKRVSTGKQPSSNNSVISTTNVETVVAYYFCQEPIPYRTTVPFREVTLAHFKSLMTRRGRFRYFFKRHSNEIEPGGVVQEEIRDDTALLPLFEGKVIGRVEKIE